LLRWRLRRDFKELRTFMALNSGTRGRAGCKVAGKLGMRRPLVNTRA